MPEKIKHELRANTPFMLDRHDKFWMVLAGQIDVYFADFDAHGEQRGLLTHLYTANKGEIILNLLTESVLAGIKLVLIGTDSRLLELDKNELMGIDPTFLNFSINKWILKISKSLQEEGIPKVFRPIETTGTFTLKQSETAYPMKGVKWCRLKSGSLEKYNGLALHSLETSRNFPIPVSPHLWIKALEKTEIEILDLREVLRDDIYFMLSLEDVQKVFYKKLIQNDLESKETELARIQNKIDTDTDKLHYALSQLKSVVKTRRVEDSLNGQQYNSQENLLLATCQLIGNETGFTFTVPKFLDSYEDSIKNQLFAIGQASKIRIRKVILRGTWWKDENGHLLAFHKEHKSPVALIQNTPNSYTYKNLDTSEEYPVNNEIAESIDPVAYMFFFSFSGKMDSLKGIMQFALKGIKKDARFLLLAALAGSLLGLLVPVLSGIMFDDVIPTADRGMHVEVFVIMLVLGIVSALLQLTQGVLQLRVETKSNVNLQGGVMDHLLRLPVSFYKDYTSGDLTNRVLSVNAIRQILSNTVLTAVLSGAFSIVNLVLLFYYQSSLAWVGVGLVFLAITLIGVIGWLKLKHDRDISDYQGEIQGFLFEFLSGITKIRITGAEKRIFSLWAEKFSKMKELAFRSGSYQNFIEVFNSSFPLFTYIFFFSFIYYLVTSNTSPETGIISIGAFMAFISAFNQFLRDALKMSMALITSLNVVSLYERVKPILESEPESTEESNDPGELMGGIELNSVSFRYNEDQPLVLNNVSLKINPGEMVAFIGPSGSGKSTIMRILLGFENPESGSVYYDGNSFESMNKDLVRRQIGVVLQNGSLMSGSIYKNIVGNSELTLDDAWEAARMAGMEEDIKQMPMEMHTMVSEGAGTFSGGQRQRLMIARAIVHKPRLLFMDEATSALDNKTQNIVSESLDNLQATRIVIAHRLSTIINADRIYVLDKGSIVESGTYNELIKKDGLFSKLAKRQIA